MKTNAVIHMLYVQDKDRSISFYTNVFGFKIISKSGFWSNLSCGNGMIAMTSHGNFESEKKTNLILEVDDHKAAAALVEKNGGRIVKIHAPYPEAAVYNVEAFDTEKNHIVISEIVND